MAILPILLFIIIVIVIVAIVRKPSFIPDPSANWLYDFGGIKFSTKEFYSEVELALKERGIPQISIESVSLNQGGLFSSSREYLRVSRSVLTFDICAAPFGNGFFVSWWFGERYGAFRSFLLRIPFISLLVARSLKNKTYYQADTEAMFREAVKSCISLAVKKMSEMTGYRPLHDPALHAVGASNNS